MKYVFAFFLAFLPPPLSNLIRRIIGYQIDKSAHISYGTIIIASNLVMRRGSKIGRFSFIRAEEVFLDFNSTINSFTLINLKVFKIGSYSKIRSLVIINSGNSNVSELVIGKHSSIFPLSWIEPTFGVYIGDQVGIGGHTLIFTHGSWGNFIDGFPVHFGPVYIGDKVWLAWRVFVMPRSRIGEQTIVSANSVVSGEVPENSLFSCGKSTVIRRDIIKNSEKEIQIKRFKYVVKNFCKSDFRGSKQKLTFKFSLDDIKDKDEILIVFDNGYTVEHFTKLASGGRVIYSHELNSFFLKEMKPEIQEFINYISFFGLRSDINICS